MQIAEVAIVAWFCASVIATIGYSLAVRRWLDRRALMVNAILGAIALAYVAPRSAEQQRAFGHRSAS